MKKYINYIKESKQDKYEKIFISLSHLDKLEIKFDFIRYKYYILYFYNESCLFQQDKKNNYFFINYVKIWLIFEMKFSLDYDDIQSITKDLVERHFKLKDTTTKCR